MPARLERITKTTNEVIAFLKQHPKIERIVFPFDPSFPQYELAKQQMTGACGLFTIILKNQSREDIVQFCESLKHFMMAVSWGGHESLILPKCAGIAPKDYDASMPDHRYIRVYTGLEDAAYLIKDLEQALSRLK